MTTTTEKTVALPWDYFFQKTNPTAFATASVDAYRRNEWKNIRRTLLQVNRWDIPEGLEPHWVGPGTAVYWQEVVRKEERFVSNKDEQVLSHTAETVDYGHWARYVVGEGKWEHTGPLPAHAGAIAHYLNKGFRLRPPQDGVEDAIKRESADLLEASEGTQEDPQQFFCFRHGEKGRLGFPNWKAYIQHCNHFNEPPLEDPPKDVLERISQYHWYCALHDTGWKENQKKLVGQHYRAERKKPGGAHHPTVDDMLVNKAKKG